MADTGQQHPISVYFWIWGLLFVFSAASYMVDYAGYQGYLRWSLIIIFMMFKAGFIVAIFMHMRWERGGPHHGDTAAAWRTARTGGPDGHGVGLYVGHAHRLSRRRNRAAAATAAVPLGGASTLVLIV